MSGKTAKRNRRESQVDIVLDIDTCQWLQGFFTALLAPLRVGDITLEAINARQTLKAIEEGLREYQDINPAIE
jgi:hypothetical protein